IGEHQYRLHATWTGDRGTGTSGYRDYDRSVSLEVDGTPLLEASADKPFRGDPGKWNPEELLLGALSECHLLSYLHACVTTGVTVVSYTD
ncbi:OsmC family peroxiredoxin, partial [Acinetobacter baumannii]